MKGNDGFERSNNLPKVMNPVVTAWIVINIQISFIPAELCTCRVILEMQFCDSYYQSENQFLRTVLCGGLEHGFP